MGRWKEKNSKTKNAMKFLLPENSKTSLSTGHLYELHHKTSQNKEQLLENPQVKQLDFKLFIYVINRHYITLRQYSRHKRTHSTSRKINVRQEKLLMLSLTKPLKVTGLGFS